VQVIPLTPATGGGLCIDAEVLEPADIVVCTTFAITSRIIDVVTDSKVSHVLVYLGEGQIIEAVPPVVRQVALDLAIHNAWLAVAYRRKDMTPAGAGAVIGYLRRQIGLSYDYIGAAEGGANANAFVCVGLLGVPGCLIARSGLLDNPTQFYCSKLVLAAFNSAGLPITNLSPNLSTPDTLVQAYSQGVLMYVGHLKD
jgi:uncharacterized protein YycO